MDRTMMLLWKGNKLLILTFALSLWSWIDKKRNIGGVLFNDSLLSYQKCMQSGNSSDRCFNYFMVGLIDGAKKVLSVADFDKTSKCIAAQERIILKNYINEPISSLQNFNKCFTVKPKRPHFCEVESSYYALTIVLAVLFVWYIIRIFRSRQKTLKEERESSLEIFRSETIQKLHESHQKHKMFTEQLNRTNQKLFELEYDNALWEKIHEVEQIQARLQLVLDQITTEFRHDINKLTHCLNSMKETQNKEQARSPLVIQVKEKGIEFDMTTKKGMGEWKAYVNKTGIKERNLDIETTHVSHEDNKDEGPDLKLPQLTPLSFSPVSPELSKVNLFDKNGKPFRRIFVPGTGWVARDKCIQIMKEVSSPSTGGNLNFMTY